jgi:hypothetical protein
MRGLLPRALTVVPSEDAKDWKAASVGAKTVATVAESFAGVARGEFCRRGEAQFRRFMLVLYLPLWTACTVQVVHNTQEKCRVTKEYRFSNSSPWHARIQQSIFNNRWTYETAHAGTADRDNLQEYEKPTDVLLM